MITGVILARDDAHRIEGKKKELLSFGGGTLILHQIKEMSKICEEIILVTNEPRTYLPEVNSAIRIITEFIPGKGILSGLHAAASLAKFNDIWVVGGNMPFVSYKAALQMWKHKQEHKCHAVVPILNDRKYPLHAIYDKQCAGKMVDMIKKGNSNVLDLLAKVNTLFVERDFFDCHPDSFIFEINTKDDYAYALETEQKLNFMY